jgi:four helix bundle protein
MGNFKDLLIYKKSFELSMEIFEISKRFPIEEKYSLTDQIRKCSRSVCANFAEAYRRRKYPAHFLSKLTDTDAENSETGVWLDFAFACKYISAEECTRLTNEKEEVGGLLGDMIKNPDKYC